MHTNKKFVVIGGGTGTYSVLSGLKNYSQHVTAIVSMADSGGSAKKERDEWGLLPSSDIRKSLLALSDVSSQNSLLLRKLFEYRYSEGIGVSGMTFGNLFLIALTKLLGSQTKAIKKAGEILHIHGKVLPVTLDKIDLVATYTDGTSVIGEHFIDQPVHNGKLKIVKLTTQPKAHVVQDVIDALLTSDAIIIGPGGFYTTIIANLVIEGVTEALVKSPAKKIFVLNLMTEYGQTYRFTAQTFLTEINNYLPVKYLDYVLINNALIPPRILNRYRKVHAEPVINNISKNHKYRVISTDLLSSKIVRKQKGDTLQRSFIRHDSEKLAKSILSLV